MKDNLKQAVKLIDAGDAAGGRRLLIELLKTEPENDAAWVWLATVVETNDLRQECLHEALKCNPRNKAARKALEKMQGSPAAWNISTAAPSHMDVARSRMRRWQNNRLLMIFMLVVGLGMIVLSFIVVREELVYQREGQVTTATATQFNQAPYTAGNTCNVAYQYAVQGVAYPGYSDFPCYQWGQLHTTQHFQVQYVASQPQQSRYYPSQKNMLFIVGLGLFFGAWLAIVGGYYLTASFARKVDTR